MLEFLFILTAIFGSDHQQAAKITDTPFKTEASIDFLGNPIGTDPFPEFTAALTDCLTYFDEGDLTVFDEGTETTEGVGMLSVFYPTMTNPPKFQIAVTQRAGILNCGGTGTATPKAAEIDTKAHPFLSTLLKRHELVEVKFPEPARVWANCDTGGDRFVMLVPAAGDLVMLSASGNEPTAKVYCDAFGVKE
ncbi:MAG: hypothetical protein ACPGRD_03440 [Planktomarina sp.]